MQASSLKQKNVNDYTTRNVPHDFFVFRQLKNMAFFIDQSMGRDAGDSIEG